MAAWIREYRESLGMSQAEFASALRAMQKRRGAVGLISVALVELLELRESSVTHPHFADVIAEACGATAAQRDMIVAEKHRGKWKAPRRPQLLTEYSHPWKAEPTVRPRPMNMPREVVAVDRDGRVVGHYKTIQEASEAWPITDSAISNRCNRGAKCDEFEKCGVMFRFAREWGRMTPEQRLREVERAADRRRK